MSNGSPLKVRIADSVSCSIVASTWPREAIPARATWWNQTNLVGIILNREYLSVSSTGDRGVCIIKDGLVTIFLRGHRAAVGEAGICHLRWFRHLKVEFARLCDHHDRSSGWELRQKDMDEERNLGYPFHQHPQTSRRRICRNIFEEMMRSSPLHRRPQCSEHIPPGFQSSQNSWLWWLSW